MVQVCTQCARANPPQAVYCYFDGNALAGHAAHSGPVAIGAQSFSRPFVFPTGRSCRSFDELALACQEEWATACGLLEDGYLENFFDGLGRSDLALAAREAARFPEPERGLDQLLAALPTSALREPKLRVEPTFVNLGLLEDDQALTFPIGLENVGMRLLHGTISSDAVWLTLGDGAGATEKHFHLTHEERITVRVRPDRVRAGTRPVEARLVVNSNGGSVDVIVRAEKQVKPFPPGPLGGARTPREVADRALKTPREVAPLFEAGVVAKWYAANGWTYPVKLPAASGPAAIQQFFEALGVTRPPRVEISHRELTLEAEPGAFLPLNLEVSTQEKRPVFAHANSNVPWLEVGRAKYNGRSVLVNMTIPTVPNRPGETLTGEVTVISNGNRRFVVPVRLAIAGLAFDPPVPAIPDSTPSLIPPVPVPPLPAEAFTLEFPSEATARPRRRSRRASRGPGPIHLVPAALLALALLGVMVYDRLVPVVHSDGGGPTAGTAGPQYDPRQLRDPKARVGVSFSEEARFGVALIDVDDPNHKGKWKRLTSHENGAFNNTRVKIGSSAYRFGFRTPNNTWVAHKQPLREPYQGYVSRMRFALEQVEVTQHVQIVPGQSMLLDTVLIYYRTHNYGTLPQNVALRIMLDTYIGGNDGVPITVPGVSGFLTSKADYKASAIPDYLEVVERPEDEKDPGTIARIGLRGVRWGETRLVEPERVTISRFPGKDADWDWDLEDMEGDSCVTVFWPEQRLEPKQTRHMAMTYGLGQLNITDRLALSAPDSVLPDREFIVTAYVYNAVQGQKVTLELPDGLSLVGEAERTIEEAGKRTQVFWKVRARREGTFEINATSGRARARPLKINVRARSIFG